MMVSTKYIKKMQKNTKINRNEENCVHLYIDTFRLSLIFILESNSLPIFSYTNSMHVSYDVLAY